MTDRNVAAPQLAASVGDHPSPDRGKKPREMPDVALERAHRHALAWVGMENIACPITVGTQHVGAEIDALVSLIDPEARGIHMSRLYLLLQRLSNAPLDGVLLRGLLGEMIESQAGLADAARLCLRFPLLLQRPALVSGFAGFKSYPVAVHAEHADRQTRLSMRVTVAYSSTCPASAALAREANAERLLQDFPAAGALDRDQLADWLRSTRGMAASAHAQRSLAEVDVVLTDTAGFGFVALIDRIEQALGTPVQTAVKRADEQAFARRNAEHLMFCEDAARRIQSALAADADYLDFEIKVRHLESLHAHDAIAIARKPR